MRDRLLWFLPASVRPAARDDQRRALLVIGGSLLTASIGAAVAAVQAAWGVPVAAAASLGGAVIAGVLPLWIRQTGRWRAAAGILTGAVWGPAFVVAVVTRGAMSAALYYLVLGAAMAALTLGHRVGLVLGVVNAVVVAAILVSSNAGVPAIVSVDAEVAQQSAMRGAFIFNLALAALVSAYELLRSAALRESEANERRYRALADQGPDLIAELNPAGQVVSGSPGGRAFADALAGVLSGAPAATAVHPDDRDTVTTAFQHLQHQPSVRVGPLRWTSDAGRTSWIEASLTHYRTASESGTLVVARDVSERIALEAQVRQSQKMQAVGQLASGLAHDFNNLLMVITGYAEILASRVKGDVVLQGATEEIHHAAVRAAALTRRLLGLASANAVTPRILDVSAVVRDCEKLLRVLLGEGITLSMETTTSTLPVRADAGELEQVLVNLVANARDAVGPVGAVRIVTERRGERAAMAVQDNGTGIAPVVLERIFEPFFTTKAPGTGTGLGLYIVYSVVTRLGGEVQVESDAAHGTRFTILLPLVGEEAGPDAATNRESATGGTERILVVEDRAELRALLQQWFEAAGYEVLVASDGAEALQKHCDMRIDLVVSDVVMPRMGGPSLVAALRQSCPRLRALLISGGPAEPAEVAAGDRLLRKPFDLQELGRAVREILDAT